MPSRLPPEPVDNLVHSSCLPIDELPSRLPPVHIDNTNDRSCLPFEELSSRLPLNPINNAIYRSCLPVKNPHHKPTQHIHNNTTGTKTHVGSGNVWYNCLKSKSIHSSHAIYTLPLPHPHLHHLSPRVICGGIYHANSLLKLSPQLRGRAGGGAVSEVEDCEGC